MRAMNTATIIIAAKTMPTARMPNAWELASPVDDVAEGDAVNIGFIVGPAVGTGVLVALSDGVGVIVGSGVGVIAGMTAETIWNA